MAMTLDGTSGITQMTGSIVMSGSTSGTTTIIPSAVAGTTTVTMPAATGTMMVSGNMPTFSAYLSTDQTIATGTFTKIAFDSKEWDTNTNFNNTGSTVGSNPSYSFLPTVAGYYQINSNVLWHNGTTTGIFITSIYKNGNEYKRGNQNAAATNDSGAEVNAIVYCNGTTDYIGIYALQNSGFNKSAYGGSALTYFQAVMVRSA